MPENKIKIPKEFYIFGQKITVKRSRSLFEKHKAWADWNANKNLIRIQIPKKGIELTQEQVEEAFIHEAVHAALDILNYEKLSLDEKFVDDFANALHQIFKTLK